MLPTLNEAPLLRWLPPFAGGIAIGLALPATLPGAWAVPVLGWALLFVLHRWKMPYRHRVWFGIVGWLVLLVTGWQLVDFTDHRQSSLALLPNETSPALYVAQVLEPTAPSASGKSQRARVRVLGRMDNDSAFLSGKAQAMLWFAVDSGRAAPQVGDRVLFRAQLGPPKPPQNPGEFDYGRYLALQQIYLSSWVAQDAWQVLAHEPPGGVQALAWRLRARFARVLHEHMPAPREEAVAAALIFGEKRGIDDDLKQAYADTGAMHLLAVSGMHVGLLAALLGAMLKPLQHWRRRGIILQALILLAVVWLFAFVTGLSGSVLRAAAMFSLLQAGTLLRREASPYNLLAGSAFVLLAWEPRLLADAGAQLSYTAVAGIFLFYKPILERWIPRNKILWAAWQLTAVSLAAQLGTLPLSLWYFHQFPLYFLLSGWVGVPLSTLALPIGLALFGLAEVPYLSDGLGWALHACVWLMNESMAWMSRLPGATLPASVGVYELVALYAGLLAFARWLYGRQKPWLVGAMACLTLAAAVRCARLLPLGQQRISIVYALRNGHAALFVHGHHAVCRSDSAARNNRQFQQALRAFRAERAIWTLSELDWDDQGTYRAPGFWSWGPFVQVSGARWGFFSEKNQLPDQDVGVNVAVFSGPLPWEPPAYLASRKIIFSPTCPGKSIRNWEKQGMLGWQTKRDGAWRD